MSTKVPAIPAPTPGNLLQVGIAVKGILDVREGLLGDPLDSNVTFRDLVDSGIAVTKPGITDQKSYIPVVPAWSQPDGYDGTTDMTTPDKPDGVVATGGFAMVQLQWNAPAYRNHSYAEIWRSTTNVIGNAILLGTSDTRFYTDSLGTGSTAYYWVRFVSQANVKGPFHAVSGLAGSTSTDPTYVMDVLSDAYGSASLAPFFQINAPTIINGLVIPAGTYIKQAFIADATISRAKIQDLAVDNAKIASLDAAKINTGFLSADRIQVGTIDAKIANIDAAKITLGTIDVARIGDATIGTAKITNGAITNAKIGDAQITTAKIADAQITSAKIGDAQITNAKIGNAEITGAKIASATISGANIGFATISGTNIGSATITGANIASATIGTANIANGAITTAKIGDAQIVAAKIADASITSAKIGNAEVGTLKLAGNAVTFPAGANGMYSATASLTTDEVAAFSVIATFTQGSPRDGYFWYLSVNGSVVQTEKPRSGTLGAMSKIVYLAAGTHSFSIYTDIASGDAACGITVLGVKR